MTTMMVTERDSVNMKEKEKKNSCTSLWLSVQSQSVDMVHNLLSTKPSDVDIPCRDMSRPRDAICTPVNKAAEMNNVDLVRLLAEHGANLNIPDNHGKVPLHHACYSGNKEMVESLLSHECQVDLVDEDGISPFYVACKHNHHEIVQLLINKGCDINKCRSDSGWHCRGFSPLHVATQYHQTSAVRALLAAGADVNQGDFRDVQPVALACEEGQLEILNLLLQYNADINHRDKNGSVALAYCFEFSEPRDVLERLLAERVDVNVRMFDQEPILHYAVRHFSADVAGMLIDNGARLDILDKRELNALYYAINSGRKDTTAVLSVHGGEITEYELENALTSLKITRGLLEVIVDVLDMSKLRNVLPKFTSGRKKLQSLVNDVLSEPSTLKRLCRDVIRETLSKKVSTSILPLVRKLRLPHVLESYVSCDGYLELVA